MRIWAFFNRSTCPIKNEYILYLKRNEQIKTMKTMTTTSKILTQVLWAAVVEHRRLLLTFLRHGQHTPIYRHMRNHPRKCRPTVWTNIPYCPTYLIRQTTQPRLVLRRLRMHRCHLMHCKRRKSAASSPRAPYNTKTYPRPSPIWSSASEF